MKKLLAMILVLCMALTMMTACGGGDGDSGAPKETDSMTLDEALETMGNTQINWAISFGAAHKVNDIFKYFADEINARSKGKITITMYPGDTLVTSSSIYDSLVQGVIDMGEADPAYSVAAFPMLSSYFLPGMSYADSRSATYVANEILTESGWDEMKDVHMLFGYGMTPSIVFGNKKAESLKDFSGMQIRATGYAISAVEGLGAAAVGITPAETYEALMKGTADAALMPAEALSSWNFAEVSKYCTKVTGISTSMHYVAINNELWNSFPTAVQKMFEEVADECVEKVAPLWDEMAEDGFRACEENNVEVIEMSEDNLAECMKALEPIRTKWVEDNASSGDSQAALDYVTGLVEKYNAK